MKSTNDNRFIWLNKGKLLAKIGNLEAALDCFDRAIAMKETYYEAWSEKGCVLEKMGRFSEGEMCFNRSLGAFCNDISLSLEDDYELSIS